MLPKIVNSQDSLSEPGSSSMPKDVILHKAINARIFLILEPALAHKQQISHRASANPFKR